MRPVVSVVWWCALLSAAGAVAPDDDAAARAARNGRQATRALVTSNRIMHGWLARRDPNSGLLPHRGRFQGSEPDPSWVVANTAADLYPFMVMAARLTEPDVYNGAMLDILRQETLLTTRVGRLSDDVKGGGQGFVRATPDMDAIIFGSGEYMKDGLIPLTELFGDTPWYHRMQGIAADIIRHAPYETSRGRLPAQTTEINGNMLQVLSRLYFKTGEKAYLDQVLAIADFYFLDMLPTTHDLPADRWDVKTQKPLNTRFVLSDHGNEIVGGLSEAFVLAMHARPDKAAQYRPAFIRMIDRLLAVGRTADGVWHHDIDIVTGKPIANRHAHCWGYMFNGVYTAYMATGEPRFREAVERALGTVTRTPTYLFDETPPVAWWSADSYSDAIESALVLLNRIPTPGLPEQIDIATAKMLDVVRPDGIVEDWYGDGNTIRTALMYVMWKAQGARLEPWNPQVHLGAERDGSSVLLSVTADRAWAGRVHFDYPRHRDHLHLPINYPRLNEWPEWFTVEHDRRYEVRVGDGPPAARLGAELVQGLALTLKEGESVRIRVNDGGAPPYGH
ncbi:hypothetical protein LuPra_01406 [Luteitalea pratensis]|uniref:Uncharacterized protein n=1 Tax=Luteitalea pratensis TaxID=1855912 RepID=A0A143PIZ6_LUTPR|nr:hypothetical protein [Luteitalea pratensis]AMY08213.1 hypothetical protein LuPra_01406 [Luteitalea pratensis]